MYVNRQIFLVFLLAVSLTSVARAENSAVIYKKYQPRTDAIVHVLTVDPTKVKIIAARAQDIGSGLDSVENIAQHFSALAAINGGFYRVNSNKPSTGLPAGILKLNNKWYGVAYKTRAAIGWDPQKNIVLLDILDTKSKLEINQQPMPLSKLDSIHNLPANDKVNIQVNIQPQLNPATAKIWAQLPFIVGGGPILIANKKIISDYGRERLRNDFISSRYARTAIGILPNKHWVMVVIEQNILTDNSGFTLAELAQFMQSLGCTDAINLDGGGSSSMYLAGTLPSDPLTIGRPVADAILVLPRG